MKMLACTLALVFTSPVFAAASAVLSNCQVVEDSFPMPMVDSRSGITVRADGSLDLALVLEVPRESGGSNIATISENFKNPQGPNGDLYKSHALTLKLTDRPTDGTEQTINVTARIAGKAKSDWAGTFDVNVLMLCQKSYN